MKIMFLETTTIRKDWSKWGGCALVETLVQPKFSSFIKDKEAAFFCKKVVFCWLMEVPGALEGIKYWGHYWLFQRRTFLRSWNIGGAKCWYFTYIKKYWGCYSTHSTPSSDALIPIQDYKLGRSVRSRNSYFYIFVSHEKADGNSFETNL